MISTEILVNLNQYDITDIAEALNKDEIRLLVTLLSEKDDTIRYSALQILERRSLHHNDVYPFWEEFRHKMALPNSYQRSIGLRLIAVNCKWDVEKQFEGCKEEYFIHFNDEKPITVRQAIQYLRYIVPYKDDLQMELAQRLMAIPVYEVKETMRKLVQSDINKILMQIQTYQNSEEIDSFLNHSLMK